MTKKPDACPKCQSDRIRVRELRRYEPDIHDPDDEKIYPFHIHYMVDCVDCLSRSEVDGHDELGFLA